MRRRRRRHRGGRRRRRAGRRCAVRGQTSKRGGGGGCGGGDAWSDCWSAHASCSSYRERRRLGRPRRRRRRPRRRRAARSAPRLALRLLDRPAQLLLLALRRVRRAARRRRRLHRRRRAPAAAAPAARTTAAAAAAAAAARRAGGPGGGAARWAAVPRSWAVVPRTRRASARRRRRGRRRVPRRGGGANDAPSRADSLREARAQIGVVGVVSTSHGMTCALQIDACVGVISRARIARQRSSRSTARASEELAASELREHRLLGAWRAPRNRVLLRVRRLSERTRKRVCAVAALPTLTATRRYGATEVVVARGALRHRPTRCAAPWERRLLETERYSRGERLRASLPPGAEREPQTSRTRRDRRGVRAVRSAPRRGSQRLVLRTQTFGRIKNTGSPAPPHDTSIPQLVHLRRDRAPASTAPRTSRAARRGRARR